MAVAGRLDTTMGGTLLSTANRGYVTNDQSADGANYDAPRRSVYLPIIRNAMYPFFGVFDYGDPSVHIEQRSSTTVATQALFLMNSPLALESAKALAARIAGEVGDDLTARLQRLYALAYGRTAAAEELATLREFVGSALARASSDAAPVSAAAGDKGDRAQALSRAFERVCLTVLASNELVFVE